MTTAAQWAAAVKRGKYFQWNESSKAKSGGNYHGLKINNFEIPAMAGIFSCDEQLKK